MIINGNYKMDKDFVKRILRARAIALSKKLPGDEVLDEQIEVIEFAIADEIYALENKFVSEVFLANEIVPIPEVPDFIVGIINIRGEIISVVDIKKFFGLPQKGVTNLHNVIVLENDAMKFGVLADEIISVENIYLNSLQSEVPTFSEEQKKYFKGINEIGMILLDAEKLLSDNNLVIDEKNQS